MELQQKMSNLIKYLISLESVAIAFSGGVDSTFLLKVAHDTLGPNAVAVTACSCSFPKRELEEAKLFCKLESIEHIVCDSEELDIDGFSQNPVNRCYLCKTELFTKMWKVAKEIGVKNIIEGSNMDDNGDYRPGLVAVKEQDIKSPLRYAELNKEEIRKLSKNMGLSTWNKQSFACLSSRFPYGETITEERLLAIDKAEQYLLDLGLKQVRVRHHSNLARIETDDEGFKILFDKQVRIDIDTSFKKIGFDYVSIDLIGYRTGSMNETLDNSITKNIAL